MLDRSFFKSLSNKDRFLQNAVFGAKMVQKRCSFPASAENFTGFTRSST